MQSLIYKMKHVPLSNVPFHFNTPAITRYFANNFPVHIAVHDVSTVNKAPEEYTQLHVHDNCDEVNIIISKKELIYSIQLNDEEFIIHNNASIYIPRNTWHKANVIKGEGYFVTIRML